MREAEMRILGIDGRTPNPRDRWQAFYRLWRVSRKWTWRKMGFWDVPSWFRAIGCEESLVRVLNADPDPLTQACPPFLRRLMVETARTRRLARKRELGLRLLQAIMQPVTDTGESERRG